jgi:hypothetical protein
VVNLPPAGVAAHIRGEQVGAAREEIIGEKTEARAAVMGMLQTHGALEE